jgi:ribosomal protein L32
MARNNPCIDRRSLRSYVSDAKDSELDRCPECGELILHDAACSGCQELPEKLRRLLRPAA